MLSLVLMASFSILSSCGGAPSNDEIEKILEKYDDDDELTESDYNSLIKYVDCAIDEVTPLFKERKKAEKDDDFDALDRLDEKIDELQDKYEYYGKALRVIRRASEDELGGAYSNAKKLMRKERRFEEKY